jgi:hypothetical protein
MPGVDVLSDMDAFFTNVRRMVETGDMPEGSRLQKGQRCLAIITPGRMISFIPALPPNSVSPDTIEKTRNLSPLAGGKQSLNISVISYTKLEALMQDRDKTKCIPFLGFLISFAYLGHNVIVFEGHPSALEAGVRNSDVLLIDSGIMPFLQDDWADVVFRVIKPNGKVFVHQREMYTLIPVVRKKSPPGWEYSEPDDEPSYARCLLTVLAKVPSAPVIISDSRGVPDLAKLTNIPEELDWISGLPFKYNELDGKMVINVVLQAAGWRWFSFFKTTRVLNANLYTPSGKLEPVKFRLTVRKYDDCGRRLEILKIQ